MQRQPSSIFPGELRRSAGFLLAGSAATATHWVAMAALVHAGLDPRIATALGATLGAGLNYLAQRSVFGGESGAAELYRYAMACLLAWSLNLSIFWLLHSVTPLTVAAAQFVTTAATAAISYFLYSRFVFHAPAPDPARI
jgi:putative flippase GtrA